MPKIPVFQEKQRANPANPTGFQSSSQARLGGDTLGGLGKQVANLGAVVAREAKKIESASTAIDVNNFNKTIEASLAPLKLEIQNRKTAGKDDLEYYNTQASEIVKNIMDSGQFDHIKSSTTLADTVIKKEQASILAIGMAKDKKALETKINTQQAIYSGLINEEPSKVFQFVDESSAILRDTYKSLGSSDEAIESEIRANTAVLAGSSINSYIRQGKFEEAGKVSSKFSQFFSPKQQEAMDNKIYNMAVKEETRNHTIWNRKRQVEKAEFEEKSLNTYLNAADMMKNAKTPTERIMAEEFMDIALLSGNLTLQHNNAMNSVAKSVQNGASGETSFHIFDKFTSGRITKDQALVQVRAKRANKLLTDDDAVSLIRSIKSASKNSAAVNRLHGTNLKLIRKTINPKATALDFGGDPKKVTDAVRAERYYEGLVFEKGISQDKALAMTWKQFIPDTPLELVPGVEGDQNSSTGLFQILRDLTRKKKLTGQPADSVYNQKMQTGKSRLEQLRLKEQAEKVILRDDLKAMIPPVEDMLNEKPVTIPFRPE